MDATLCPYLQIERYFHQKGFNGSIIAKVLCKSQLSLVHADSKSLVYDSGYNSWRTRGNGVNVAEELRQMFLMFPGCFWLLNSG